MRGEAKQEVALEVLAQRARKEAAGLPGPRLASDWLAIDRNGCLAFFVGGERGPIPTAAAPEASDEAIALLAEHRGAAQAGDDLPGGYREGEHRVAEPVFDPPRTSSGAASHETPIEGYPLLVTGRPDGSQLVRDEAQIWGAHEALVSTGFGVVFGAIGPDSYAQMHEESRACNGCRVLDDPSDPRPRSAEALAASGFYVYVHVAAASTEPYRRVASPSAPARLSLTVLPALVTTLASRVELPIAFDQTDSLTFTDLAAGD